MKTCIWLAAFTCIVVVGLLLWGLYILGGRFEGLYSWKNDPGYAYSGIRFAQYPVPPMWSKDGERVVFNDGFRMHAVALDSSSVNSFRPAHEYSLEYAASLSPDGTIAMVQRNHPFERITADRRFQIATIDVDGLNHQLLLANQRIDGDNVYHFNAYHPVWSPSGEHIAYLMDKSVYSTVQDNFVRIGAGVRADQYLFLHIADRNGSGIHAYVSDIVAQYHPPAWSFDGKKIAFIGNEIQVDTPERPFMVVADSSDSSIIKIQPTSSIPAWSPDDNRIAFVEHKDNVSTIYTVKANGANLREIASFPDALPKLKGTGVSYPLGGLDRLPRGHVSWSSDGSEIRLHQSPFVVVNADGSNLRIMRGRPDALASWSPNESQIAVYMPGHATRLFTMAPDGSNKQSLVRWDNDAQEFVVDHRPLDIDGFDWERYPSPRVER